MRLFEQADLERALGGAAVLVQLGDKNRDGYADTDFVDDCINNGSSEMLSLIQRGVDIGSLKRPYPPALVFKAADMGAFVAWSRGSDRQAAPQNIKDAHEAAVSWGTKVGDRLATLGVSPKPTLDPPAQMVDPDPRGTGVSIAGFKRGYR